MESGPPTPLPPPKKTLETYAVFYLGAYLNTVKKERPEHLPILARGSQHLVEVCIMPNGCYSLLFLRADKQEVVVRECDWEYVEQEIEDVCSQAHRAGAKVKVIFENDYLTEGGAGLGSDEFKKKLCRLCERAGADW